MLIIKRERVRFFDPSNFYHGFFTRFGPRLIGIPLHGAWWILVYYGLIMFVCNIDGGGQSQNRRGPGRGVAEFFPKGTTPSIGADPIVSFGSLPGRDRHSHPI